MKAKDIFWLSAKGMKGKKFRVALTVLTVVIGIAAIVALISLVSGVSASISHSLESVGPTTLYLIPSGSHIFTDADIAEIESLNNVSSVIPVVSFSGNLSEAGTSTAVTVYGVENSSLVGILGSINLLEGSAYNSTNLPYALIGYDIAFPTTGQLSSSISLDEPIYLTTHTQGGGIGSVTLVPVGILSKYGTTSFISPDSSIFIPLQAAESLSNKYSYSELVVKASSTATVGSVDTLLTDIYGSNARIISVQELASTISSVIGTLSLLLAAIAGISLLVAGISILSIMMVSVAERTHEIGILKSIGFRKKDVMTLFLSESIIIGLLGGVIGVVAGTGAAFALPSFLTLGSHSSTAAASPAVVTGGHSGFSGGGGGFAAGGFGGNAGFAGGAGSSSTAASSLSITPVISPLVIIAAILIAVGVSAFASMYPAWKASKIEPIEALRTE
ncbi:MAG: FtsX-like permease family protein [Candidatus Micrarchaeaceae archaeon]